MFGRLFIHLMGVVIVCSSLSSMHAQNSESFSSRIEQLKPEIKQTLIENIRRHWTLKTAQKMQAQGYSELEIESVVLGQSFEHFLNQLISQNQIQKSIDRYINITLNEENLLKHIQMLESQQKQKQLAEYKEVLRIISQMRKEQTYVKEKKSWYQRFFEDFKLF